MFAAIRRASSLVSSLAAERRPRNRRRRAPGRCVARWSSCRHGGGKRRAVTAAH